MTNEQVLAWAKRVKVQKAQSMIIKSFTEIDDLDEINPVREVQRQIERKPQADTKVPTKLSCGYFGSNHMPRQ